MIEATAATDIADLDAVGLAQAIRTKAVSATEVIEALQKAAERAQPILNCFVRMDFDRARDAARLADDELARGKVRGPLHGVPLGHKDMFYRRGETSACGSGILRNFRADRTATVLDRLDAAGAIDIGALHMAEFALNATGHNIHFGACRNPWNTARISGGSSSGSCSAVAARLSYGSLGSDTGGSIRLPAALCGVVGLKPTLSRVSRYGAMPMSHSLDQPGPIATTVRDVASLLGVIAGSDGLDPLASTLRVPDYGAGLGLGIKGMRIGVPKEFFYDNLSGTRLSAVIASLEALRDLGAEIVEVDFPEAALCSVYHALVLQTEVSSVHGAWLRSRPGDYSRQVRHRAQGGLAIPATRYHEALARRGHLLDRVLNQVFSVADVLHVPTTPIATPTVEESDETTFDCRTMLSDITRNTRIFNYLGLPAINIPCGFDDRAMPVGFQLVGKPFAEARLFRVGHAYQAVTSWHQQRPHADLLSRSALPEGL